MSLEFLTKKEQKMIKPGISIQQRNTVRSNFCMRYYQYHKTLFGVGLLCKN